MAVVSKLIDRRLSIRPSHVVSEYCSNNSERFDAVAVLLHLIIAMEIELYKLLLSYRDLSNDTAIAGMSPISVGNVPKAKQNIPSTRLLGHRW